ncbi:MAG: alpha-L-fucosidase [Acidobacteria bacterium]|nr:alpha-L-fucosidase [Acidobacteriota bacterium]
MTRRTLLETSLALAAPSLAARSAAPPPPYGAIPSRRQQMWQKLEVYSFLHFTVNTFTDKEWGYGDESPDLFHPTAFDADAIVSALRAGGMQGVILTCKHHDGFCLWPTKTTEHSVKNSRWRGGKGDVVKELAEAARRHGLRFGVYLSPWDRNNAFYAKPEYVAIYRAQLQELLTGYGPVFEVWHDGANGGDGYYGGAREKRTIDKRIYYDWGPTWDMVRALQPDANIFSDAGPDIRWVGNEKGIAGDPCWAAYDPVGTAGGAGMPGDTKYQQATNGHRLGSRWMPAECDVSMRPGWFWHEQQNGRVKTPEQLMDLYFQSVGRGANLLLNIPPDRRGLLHENDAASLRDFGERLTSLFRENLAARARVKASNVRGAAFRAENLVDGRSGTFWSTADPLTAAEVTLEFASPVSFRVVRLREHTPLGQRVDRFAIDTWRDGEWKTAAESTSIGSCRLIRLDQALRTNKVRLRILAAQACPAIEELGIFGG